MWIPLGSRHQHFAFMRASVSRHRMLLITVVLLCFFGLQAVAQPLEQVAPPRAGPLQAAPSSSAASAQMQADARGAVRAGPGNVDDGYRLGSGDRIRVTVYGQPELTGEYAIDGGGQLSFPLIGQIRAGGLTAGELEKGLVGKLQPNYLTNPSVSVEVLTYRPFYIVGEVRVPGSYAYVNGMTVLNAIALAGGFTYRARENKFYVTRAADAGRVKIDANQDTTIYPGDIITVRERFF